MARRPIRLAGEDRRGSDARVLLSDRRALVPGLLPSWWLLLAGLMAQDPEATAAGRTHYLGREIAQTMHWTGAPWLMRATREEEESGALLREWLAVQPGHVVCDLGCGNGYHTLPLAEAVGAGGSVYAVELQPQMLELLRQRARPRRLDNIRMVTCTVDDPKLPPGSCDLVLLVDVYHELSHPVRVMRHVRDALRPGGSVVLVEFRAEDPAVPIKPEHTMTKAQVLREMSTHGFVFAAETDALPWQHAMRFVPAVADARLGARQVLSGCIRAANGDDDRVLRPFLGPGMRSADVPPIPGDCRIELRSAGSGGLVAELRAADGSRLPPGRDCVELGVDAQGRWFVQASRAPRPDPRGHGAALPFVAMHTGLGAGTVEQRVALVAELGFDGVAWDLDQLPAVRQACERLGLDLWSAYVVLDLGGVGAVPEAGTVPKVEAALQPALQAMHDLAGGPGLLWLALRHVPGVDAAAQEAVAMAALQRLRDEAAATGIEVALYPHHGFWLATVEHALQLSERIDDARIGLCFNLCHFLRTTDQTDCRPALLRCGPRLLAATVNGADVAGDDWRALIQPLDAGDHPLAQFLEGLAAAGFAGPVGLQGFGIEAAPREHLGRSMQQWRKAHAR